MKYIINKLTHLYKYYRSVFYAFLGCVVGYMAMIIFLWFGFDDNTTVKIAQTVLVLFYACLSFYVLPSEGKRK